MTITWTQNIPFTEKEMILNKIEEIEGLEVDSFEEFEAYSDEHGSFSTIYFVGKYALKYTSFWDCDELDGPTEEIASHTHISYDFCPSIQSDNEIISLVGEHPCCVKMFGYNSNWVILEKIEGYTINDSFLIKNKKIQLNDIQIKLLEDFVLHCLQKGVFPIDINAGSVFLPSENELRIIDFNLYQLFSDLMDYEFKIPSYEEMVELSKEIVSEVKFVNKRQS